MKKTLKFALLCTLLLPLPSQAKPPAAPSAKEQIDACVQSREQAQSCKDPFIDAMIELRARHQPAIADAIKTPDGKRQVRETGLRELAADGGGPLAERRKKCEAAVAHMTMPRPDLDALKSCYAKPDCATKVACIMPILEKNMFPAAAAK